MASGMPRPSLRRADCPRRRGASARTRTCRTPRCAESIGQIVRGDVRDRQVSKTAINGCDGGLPRCGRLSAVVIDEAPMYAANVDVLAKYSAAARDAGVSRIVHPARWRARNSARRLRARGHARTLDDLVGPLQADRSFSRSRLRSKAAATERPPLS